MHVPPGTAASPPPLPTNNTQAMQREGAGGGAGGSSKAAAAAACVGDQDLIASMVGYMGDRLALGRQSLCSESSQANARESESTAP